MAVRRRAPHPERISLRVLGASLLVAGLLVSACEGETLYEPTGPGTDPTDPAGPGNGTPGVSVSIALEFGDRVELTDSLRVSLTAFDPTALSGIQRLGYTLIITGEDGARTAVTNEQTVSQSVARGDTIRATFRLAPTWVAAADLPASFQVEAFGYAFNRAGDCSAAVPERPGDNLACRLGEVGGQSYRISDPRPTPRPLLAVAGRTTLFPTASIIVGDLVVDHGRGNLFVSNRQSNRLHVFRPADFAWTGTVAVGSEPWGLHLNRTGDTLLVANSGGTSISHVALSPSGGQEVVGQRLQTRNTVLYEIELRTEGDPRLVESFSVYDFSDRPQFVAQDAQGRMLYSTRPTAVAPTGTIRWVENQPGWTEPETRIVARAGGNPVREEVDVRREEDFVVVSQADSIIFFTDGEIQVFDHLPGFPEEVISSAKAPPLVALAEIASNPNSDVRFIVDAVWELEAVSFSDTTYVATSADREYVAFGDGGAAANPGKISLWHAGTGTLASRLSVADLVNNASERVNALELNANGSLGVARGAFGTYFFSNDLRLRGTVPEAAPGGGGAAFHPLHPSTALPSAPTMSTLAFTVSGGREIRILDTVHYLERGRIPIRDAIAGPMRVTPPLASDNGGQGANCTGPSCVIAKLYAVTEAGGVVVVDIRASHVQPVQ
jgi:hypothetical protein